MLVNDFWRPKYKWQLVDWLSMKYIKDNRKFKTYNRNRLYAIYYSIRKKENNE